MHVSDVVDTIKLPGVTTIPRSPISILVLEKQIVVHDKPLEVDLHSQSLDQWDGERLKCAPWNGSNGENG